MALDGLAKEEEKEVIKDVGFVIEIEEEQDLVQEKEDEDEPQEEVEEDEDVYKDLLLHPEVTNWVKDEIGETVHGIQVLNVVRSTDCKRDEFDLCPICVKPWTLDKIHQMSCLPCGHMFGMSCLQKWIKDRPSSKCPECHQIFSLRTVRLLYAPRLCIPAAAYKNTSYRGFSFSKLGFTAFNYYEGELRTNAVNNKSDVLKQRADVLGRQNDAMKRQTELLNRMAVLVKRADVLEWHSDAMKRQTQLLNRVTDEEEWAEASEQQADAEKRAEVFRRKAGALGQSADEYLRKADAFGQQAKALRQQAKSLRQLVDSYLATRKFYIRSYKGFLGLRDNKQVDHISPLVELDGLSKKDHKEEKEDVYKDLVLNPEVKDDTGETVHGIQEKEEGEKDEDKHQEEEVDDDTGETVHEEGEEKDDKVEYISLLELDEAEKEVAKEMEMDHDDDDEDFEKVEELTLPLVSKWKLPDYDASTYGLEVPVLKDDEFIHDSLYRNDIDMDDIDDADDDDIDPPLPPHVFDPLPPPPAPVCSICYTHWTPLHHFRSLPCGHIFGAQCIQNWIQPGLYGTCPQCNNLCSLENAIPLYKTRMCIPAADKGVADPEISTIRFPYSKQGMVKFRKLESGRRNFALKKRSDAKKRLAGVVGRKNDLMKRRADLLDRRASVLNRAMALEKRGGSLCRVDALRLRADALGRWADEYLRRAKACEERAKALGQRARAYNQRVKEFEARLLYFRHSYDNLKENTTDCAAAATCHKD